MILVVPDSHGAPSGGNIFNRLLLRALRKKGVEAEALTVGPALSRMRQARAGSWWVDSLCLDALDKFVALQAGKRRVYALIHDLPSLEPSLSPAARRIREAKENRALRDVSGFLVTSPSTRALLRKRRLTGGPILVVPPAPAVLPGRRRAATGRFAGLMVNNLIRRKGVLEFLRCLGRRLKESDDLTLRLAGRVDIEPGYAERCLDLIRASACLRDRVRYLGPLPSAEVKRCYETSTLFITASRLETFGMAVQEARLFGLPVLALEADYARRRLQLGRSGLLFPSTVDLAEACLRYVRDPSALEALAARARASAPHSMYDWEDAAQLFLDQLPP